MIQGRGWDESREEGGMIQGLGMIQGRGWDDQGKIQGRDSREEVGMIQSQRLG